MTADPNVGNLLYGIVVGGNDSDPDPTMSGGCRVYLPHMHGSGVNIQHLPFARSLAQGNQNGVINTNPPPEHGAAVMCMKLPGQAGTGHLMLMGAVSNEIFRGGTTPGNSTGIWPAIDKAIKDIAQINIPPNIGSGPAGSKPPQEKGQKYKHELVKGIPSAGALWPMVGPTIPQMSNITTAVQAYSSILTGDMLSKLPGMSMSLGGLLSGMGSELLGQLMSKLPPEIGAAMTSMSNLMQTIESNESGGFSMANKVNPDVFFQNAVDLIGESKTIYDLVGSFQRLQHDTSLYGLDSLPPVNMTLSGGPFGDIPIAVDALGNITQNMPEAVQKLAELFGSLMTNKSGGFPGVFPNKNMFGESAPVLNDMFNRLPNTELNKAVTQMQKNVAPGTDPRSNLTEVLKTAMQGGTHGLALLKKMK